MYPRAAALEREGADVIHLEVGRPAFDTPVDIKEAAKQALDAGIVHYGDLQGTERLRQALARKLSEFNGLPAGPENVLVTTGLTQASFATFMAALDPGDEVLVLEPRYPQHPPKIALTGATVVPVPLDPERGYRVDPERVEAAITPRTKMLVLVNPANPVGTVFTRDELAVLADIAIRRDLLVVTDEVYEYITYDGRQHTSIAALPGMWERTVSLFAFTKAYAMDGWRLGYAVAPTELLGDIHRIAMNETTHPNVFAQEGAVAAVEGDQQPRHDMVAEDRRCRDLVYERLNAMPGVRCHLPEGSIYAFPDVSGLGQPDPEFAEQLLHEAHVATEPGSSYGAMGQGHLRVCFGSEPYARLEEAMDRMAKYVQSVAPAHD
ncbi:pyridoxal phosphate-dependent aminotransferase [Egibacter rhizosphaerae]|uniref:Pyridoxal phosphate-dependent aminotransferase n=2 Tax=Egibacter rhizosphaerae TaxID=1670831 RepID=A0A411YLD0_9ACTN|nr:pyridoxal phosphate-dependent aminotransferase [Egibacter rhizosphaerae]